MGAVKLIAWAVVELQAAKPNVRAIQEALERALDAAATLQINHDLRRDNLIRLSQVTGEENHD